MKSRNTFICVILLVGAIFADRLVSKAANGQSTVYLPVVARTGGTWQPAGAGSASGGGISNNLGDSSFPALSVAPSGMPYAAWKDDTSGDREIYIRVWNGSNWVEVGIGSASGGGISNNVGVSQKPGIAIAPNGTPYVTWEDNSNGNNEIYVRAWDGSSWKEVGTGSASGGGISNNTGASENPAIAIAPDGTVYVTWDDSSSGGKQIYVRAWNGSSWEEVGSGSASGGGISNSLGHSNYPSLAIDSIGIPYIIWKDDTNYPNSEIFAMRYTD